MYLAKTEAPGLIPASPQPRVSTSCSPVLLLQYPMRSSLISHHVSPARATSPGPPAHTPPVVSSLTLHFGISQQGHHLGIMVPSLHGMAVVPSACSGVHLGLVLSPTQRVEAQGCPTAGWQSEGLPVPLGSPGCQKRMRHPCNTSFLREGI